MDKKYVVALIKVWKEIYINITWKQLANRLNYQDIKTPHGLKWNAKNVHAFYSRQPKESLKKSKQRIHEKQNN